MNSYADITQDLAQKLQEEDELRYRSYRYKPIISNSFLEHQTNFGRKTMLFSYSQEKISSVGYFWLCRLGQALIGPFSWQS